MKTICAWCSETPVGETVSHGICSECEAKHFPDLADEPANNFFDTVVGNPAEAQILDSYGVNAGCHLVVHYKADKIQKDDLERIDRWKDDTLLGAARRLVAALRMNKGTNDPDCLPGIEFDDPRRSLFSQRNRFREGVLGNMLLRSGAMRRVA